jgi:hypothetical protein
LCSGLQEEAPPDRWIFPPAKMSVDSRLLPSFQHLSSAADEYPDEPEVLSFALANEVQVQAKRVDVRL